MKAGASVRALRFPEGFFPTEGFARPIDTLHARVLVLDGALRHALLVLEMTSIPGEEIDALSAILKEETDAAHTFVLASHTFSAPHFMPDHALKTEAEREKKRQLQTLVYEAVRAAAREAAGNVAEVFLSLGTGECAVCTARDVLTEAGWWIANCGEGPVDPVMTVLRMQAGSGRTAAVLVHYSVQSSVLDGSELREGGKAVSGDLAGRMAAELEEELGAPVLFLNGAAGDQAPREKAVGFIMENSVMRSTDMQDDAIALCGSQAHEMAEAARRALAGAKPVDGETLSYASCTVKVPDKKIERDLKKLHPTRIPPYEANGESEQTVELLRVGPLSLVGVKPELNCVTAQAICGGDPHVRVVTLWNGGAKYMADVDSYDRITYESQNSPFGRGAAELLTQAARKLLRG